MSKSTSNIPERFIWATELADIKPTRKILEIGCGAGILAEQIAAKLTGGQFIAIDRSVAMLEKAKKRNKRFIDEDISKFIASDFLGAELEDSYFDTIVAFNINFFWKNSRRELQKIKQLLATKGRLYVFYDSPYQISISAANPIVNHLVANSFDIIDVQLKKLVPSSALGIVAKPGKSRY